MKIAAAAAAAVQEMTNYMSVNSKLNAMHIHEMVVSQMCSKKKRNLPENTLIENTFGATAKVNHIFYALCRRSKYV